MSESTSYYEYDESNASTLDLYINARFKEDTTADLAQLDKWYERSLTKFCMIYSPTIVSVYKILHYFEDNFGLKKNNIKTIDADAIESYFEITAKHTYNMMRIDKLLESGVLRDIDSKWLVIPNMSAQWNRQLAYLFYNEVKEHGALGIIFHSEGNFNFGQIVVEQTYLHVLQFPEEVYNGRKKIEDDEW